MVISVRADHHDFVTRFFWIIHLDRLKPILVYLNRYIVKLCHCLDLDVVAHDFVLSVPFNECFERRIPLAVDDSLEILAL